MPVSITTLNSAVANYLTPAPFVAINKTFDKQGDGEILGSRYSITLTGWILADRGSPLSNGTFAATDADPSETITGDKFYLSLQHKQKAISNLISKMHSGAMLEVTAPIDGPDEAGFVADVRLESVDLPTHDPGDPYKAQYTINLTADYIAGPAGTAVSKDKDNWPEQNKWLVSSASENWTIDEADKLVYLRYIISEGAEGEYPDEDDPEYAADQKNKGNIKDIKRAYVLTRTIQVTGKNKFARNSKADGLGSDGFTQVYAANGRAWQQARGFTYDIIKYGNQFLYGKNLDEYVVATGGIPTGAETTDLAGTSNDADDIHLFATNLPTAGSDGIVGQYKAFDYKRVQSSDVRAGTFAITETWLMAPSYALAIESVDFSVSESSTGNTQVTINGVIQGLAPVKDTGSSSQGSPTRGAESIPNVYSKFANAQAYFDLISGNLVQTARSAIRELADYSSTEFDEIPSTKTVGMQPGTATITYSVTYEVRAKNKVPFALDENINVNDTYPGQVVAQHAVLGRRIGPVLQSIGTQTVWQRDLTISLRVNTSDEYICVDKETKKQMAGKNEEMCDERGGEWVTNPNFVDIDGWLDSEDCTDKITLSKPGSNRSDQGKVQAEYINKIICSFDPKTYLQGVDENANNNVRKRFINPPQESWNFRTGEWSYAITWIYEINDPWAFPTSDYVDPNAIAPQDDELKEPNPRQNH